MKVFEVGPATPQVEPGAVKIVDGRPILGLAGGAVELVEIQPSGKPRLSGRAWANGRRGVGLAIENVELQ